MRVRTAFFGLLFATTVSQANGQWIKDPMKDWRELFSGLDSTWQLTRGDTLSCDLLDIKLLNNTGDSIKIEVVRFRLPDTIQSPAGIEIYFDNTYSRLEAFYFNKSIPFPYDRSRFLIRLKEYDFSPDRYVEMLCYFRGSDRGYGYVLKMFGEKEKIDKYTIYRVSDITRVVGGQGLLPSNSPTH